MNSNPTATKFRCPRTNCSASIIGRLECNSCEQRIVCSETANYCLQRRCKYCAVNANKRQADKLEKSMHQEAKKPNRYPLKDSQQYFRYVLSFSSRSFHDPPSSGYSYLLFSAFSFPTQSKSLSTHPGMSKRPTACTLKGSN